MAQRPPAKKLEADFYLRKTETVARDLLGCLLVHELPNGEKLSGRIVETEAYIGIEDAASHSFGSRKTERVSSMYLEGGHAYIYLIYGLHFCLNVVTRKAGDPQAVLIRGLEPVSGIEEMRRQRLVEKDRDLTNGPGKLCEALMIDRALDGTPLSQRPLWIEPRSERISPSQIAKSARIGVDYAGEAAAWPLRFYLKTSLYVSRTPGKKRPSSLPNRV